MNTEFFTFLITVLTYMLFQDRIRVTEMLGRFGQAYQTAWAWIRDNVGKIVRDEEQITDAWSTHTLIFVATASYMLSLSLGYEQIIRDFAFVPALAHEYWRWISHMFLHANIPVELSPFSVHLLYNMLYLYVFGDNVEEVFEKLKYEGLGVAVNLYLLAYLFWGFIAVAVQATVVGWSSAVSMIGASGAISGVVGAYVVLFPKNRVVYGGRLEMPAIVFVAIFVGSQFLFMQDATAAVAAHLGGFVAGVLTGVLLRRAVNR